jgi:hypothetical protein
MKSDAGGLASVSEELTTRYEELRDNVVNGGASAARACGLAVFLRHGMAKWMKMSSELVPTQPSRCPESTPSQSIVPPAIEQEVVNVLAEMALGAHNN